MQSTGNVSLMCGGYTGFTATAKTYAAASAQDGSALTAADGTTAVSAIDCWWLIPSPRPQWSRFLYKNPTVAGVPTPREGFTMDYDFVERSVLIFGGLDSSNQNLNDCWYISLGPDDKVAHLESYDWKSCRPTTNATGEIATQPPPRFGHGSAYFAGMGDKSLYIFGGFADDGIGIYAQGDMWRLAEHNTAAARWTQVDPVSIGPAARGFHAMWRAGFKIIVHGGQGADGVGTSSVLQDTWALDLFTLVWRQYSASDTIPVVSHMTVAALDDARAVVFGGTAETGSAIGGLYVFDTSHGWEKVLPAGVRPQRRAGHVAVLDQPTNQLYVSFGLTEGPAVLTDTWRLNLETMKWACVHGGHSSCPSPAVAPPFGPGPLAYAGGVSAGMYKYVFGGVTSLECVAGADGATIRPTAANELWALSLQSNEWKRIIPTDRTKVPSARAFTQMAAPGQQGGAKELVVLIGGASFACYGLAEPCKVPQPLKDVWVADLAPKETSTTDKMAEFDGQNDIVLIELPVWCHLVESLSVFWMDAWIFPLNRGYEKAILFDAYQLSANVRSCSLRWFIEGRQDGNVYISLLFNPGSSEVLVKEWGPMPSNFLSTWHHVAVTLRFARIFTPTSESPAVTIPQAFLFVDGASMPASNAGEDFLTIDLKNSLVLQSGIASIVIGGPDPDIAATDYKNFKGAVDDVRIWWPQCPSAHDPSKCNPYAFLYPKLSSGLREPAAVNARGDRVHDNKVTMEMVAKPVRDAMFKRDLSDAESEGLLAYYDFNEHSSRGVVRDMATSWISPDQCADSQVGQACPGCEPECVFGNCKAFDVDCIVNYVDDQDAINNIYSQTGLCQCRNVESCPTTTKDCLCPGDLNRVCGSCALAMYTDDGNGTALCVDADGPARPDEKNPYGYPRCADVVDNVAQNTWHVTDVFCPADAYCDSWTCGCYDPATDTGVYRSGWSIDQIEGTGQCTKTCPESTEDVYTGTGVHGQPPTTIYPCCDQISRCLAWDLEAGTCTSGEFLPCKGDSCPTPRLPGTTESCGITSCCSSFVEPETPAPQEKEQQQRASGPSIKCEVKYNEDETIKLVCDLDADGEGTYSASLGGSGGNTGGTGGGGAGIGSGYGDSYGGYGDYSSYGGYGDYSSYGGYGDYSSYGGYGGSSSYGGYGGSSTSSDYSGYGGGNRRRHEESGGQDGGESVLMRGAGSERFQPRGSHSPSASAHPGGATLNLKRGKHGELLLPEASNAPDASHQTSVSE
jgi:hypothetical protein